MSSKRLFLLIFAVVWLTVGISVLISGILALNGAVEITGDIKTGGLLFVGLGAFFSLGGGVCALFLIKDIVKQRKLLTSGEYILTDDWYTDYSGTTINGVRQLCICADYTDGFGGIYHFRGQKVFSPYRINEYDRDLPLRIYVDLKNPKDYYVDNDSVKANVKYGDFG